MPFDLFAYLQAAKDRKAALRRRPSFIVRSAEGHCRHTNNAATRASAERAGRWALEQTKQMRRSDALAWGPRW